MPRMDALDLRPQHPRRRARTDRLVVVITCAWRRSTVAARWLAPTTTSVSPTGKRRLALVARLRRDAGARAGGGFLALSREVPAGMRQRMRPRRPPEPPPISTCVAPAPGAWEARWRSDASPRYIARWRPLRPGRSSRAARAPYASERFVHTVARGRLSVRAASSPARRGRPRHPRARRRRPREERPLGSETAAPPSSRGSRKTQQAR